jgi:hypothetical protein
MLPTMIKTRLLNGGLGGGDPHSRPFQYARPAMPVGSGYQPGIGDGAVVKTSPGFVRWSHVGRPVRQTVLESLEQTALLCVTGAYGA